MPSNGATHTDLVKSIKRLIHEHGGFCFKNWGGPMGTKGVADLIGCYRGKAVAIEVKAGKDKLTEDQAAFLRRWQEAGGVALEARDLPTVARALGIPMLL
jgi:hypothetical protein